MSHQPTPVPPADTDSAPDIQGDVLRLGTVFLLITFWLGVVPSTHPPSAVVLILTILTLALIIYLFRILMAAPKDQPAPKLWLPCFVGGIIVLILVVTNLVITYT